MGKPVQWIREKRKQYCFRTFIPKVTKDSNGYFSSILTLFLPWRSHTYLLLPFNTYEQAYYNKAVHIDQDSLENFHYHERFVAAIQQIRLFEGRATTRYPV